MTEINKLKLVPGMDLPTRKPPQREEKESIGTKRKPPKQETGGIDSVELSQRAKLELDLLEARRQMGLLPKSTFWATRILDLEARIKTLEENEQL